MIDRARRLLTKRRDYRATFLKEDGKTLSEQGEGVMLDLARFCYALSTTSMVSQNGTIDPIASAIAEGRRQVYLRILATLRIPDSAILEASERAQND
jgi:hypothetical protein